MSFPSGDDDDVTAVVGAPPLPLQSWGEHRRGHAASVRRPCHGDGGHARRRAALRRLDRRRRGAALARRRLDRRRGAAVARRGAALARRLCRMAARARRRRAAPKLLAARRGHAWRRRAAHRRGSVDESATTAPQDGALGDCGDIIGSGGGHVKRVAAVHGRDAGNAIRYVTVALLTSLARGYASQPAIIGDAINPVAIIDRATATLDQAAYHTAIISLLMAALLLGLSLGLMLGCMLGCMLARRTTTTAIQRDMPTAAVRPPAAERPTRATPLPTPPPGGLDDDDGAPAAIWDKRPAPPGAVLFTPGGACYHIKQCAGLAANPHARIFTRRLCEHCAVPPNVAARPRRLAAARGIFP